MNFDRLRFVAERAELGEAREALFGVTIPERPGAFREFCAAIGRRVVTEFNYRLSGRDQAHIFVGIATRSRQDAADARRARSTARGYRDDRSDRQRDGQAARPPHGRRPQRRCRERAGLPLRVPRAARRADGSSSTSSAAAGTSACSTTAITAPTSAASSRGSRCRLPSWIDSKRSSTGSGIDTSVNARTRRTICFCLDEPGLRPTLPRCRGRPEAPVPQLPS